MCYRAMKDASMAKKWLKKSHTKYTGNFAEPMISFRAQLALESLKKINDTNSEEWNEKTWERKSIECTYIFELN